MQVHSCMCEAQNLLGSWEMLKVPWPRHDLITGTEIPSLLVHQTHSGERSFWKENKATSHHHFSNQPSGQVWDWLTRFSISDSSKLSTSGLNCQLLTTWPVRKHRHISDSDHKHYLAVLTPFMLPKPLLIWGSGGSSRHVLNLTLKQLFQKIPFLRNSASPHNKCHQTDIKYPPLPHLVLTTLLWITQTHMTGPLLTTEHRSQTCVNWAWLSVQHQDTRAPDLFHHCHCWHWRLQVLRRTSPFDLWRSDSVTLTMFAACIYSSSAVAGSTSEGWVLE